MRPSAFALPASSSSAWLLEVAIIADGMLKATPPTYKGGVRESVVLCRSRKWAETVWQCKMFGGQGGTSIKGFTQVKACKASQSQSPGAYRHQRSGAQCVTTHELHLKCR